MHITFYTYYLCMWCDCLACLIVQDTFNAARTKAAQLVQQADTLEDDSTEVVVHCMCICTVYGLNLTVGGDVMSYVTSILFVVIHFTCFRCLFVQSWWWWYVCVCVCHKVDLLQQAQKLLQDVCGPWHIDLYKLRSHLMTVLLAHGLWYPSIHFV